MQAKEAEKRREIVAFEVEVEGAKEQHRLFPGYEDSDPDLELRGAGEPAAPRRLMIASRPLPVTAFIFEMHTQYERLRHKVHRLLPNQFRSVDPDLTADDAMMRTYQSVATNATATANAEIANPAATWSARLLAEQNVAIALKPMIALVIKLAKDLGTYLAKGKRSGYPNKPTGKYRNVTSDLHYRAQMSRLVARYRVEGLVATYAKQPDYVHSGFERDHQPHSDLLKKVASQTEFADRQIKQVVSGKQAQGGWTIMLHDQRHRAGRTYKQRGKTVSSNFLKALKDERKRLARLLRAAMTEVHDALSTSITGTSPALAKAVLDVGRAKNKANHAVQAVSSSPDACSLVLAAEMQLIAADRALQATPSAQSDRAAVTAALSHMSSASALARSRADDVRAFCVAQMVDSLEQDAQAMKNVVASPPANFSDIEQLTHLNQAERNTLMADIKAEVEAGEDRLLLGQNALHDYARP
ncbi:hypothetical protein [Lentzea fradiae]|nr:hypothetical protein [Lentzea fradiae]